MWRSTRNSAELLAKAGGPLLVESRKELGMGEYKKLLQLPPISPFHLVTEFRGNDNFGRHHLFPSCHTSV